MSVPSTTNSVTIVNQYTIYLKAHWSVSKSMSDFLKQSLKSGCDGTARLTRGREIPGLFARKNICRETLSSWMYFVLYCSPYNPRIFEERFLKIQDPVFDILLWLTISFTSRRRSIVVTDHLRFSNFTWYFKRHFLGTATFSQAFMHAHLAASTNLLFDIFHKFQSLPNWGVQ